MIRALLDAVRPASHTSTLAPRSKRHGEAKPRVRWDFHLAAAGLVSTESLSYRYYRLAAWVIVITMQRLLKLALTVLRAWSWWKCG